MIDEVSAGDPGQAERRMKVIEAFPQLDITDDVTRLAEALFLGKVIPHKAATDAAHIAIAAVHGMDYLMTWNCTHIANAIIFSAARQICLEQGFTVPIICTPEELMGEEL